MLLDSQRQLNKLMRQREARKHSPKKKSLESLLKSHEEFSDYVAKNPRSQKRVTFYSPPENEKRVTFYSPPENETNTFSKEHCENITIRNGCGKGKVDFSSVNSNNVSSSSEEPSLITAVVRLVCRDVMKCVKVKLMVNIQQFQELRIDSKRLKLFKKKLEPIILDLLPADDKLKPWTIDSIEPYDCEMSCDKSFTGDGTKNVRVCSYEENRFEESSGYLNYNYRFGFKSNGNQSNMDYTMSNTPSEPYNFDEQMASPGLGNNCQTMYHMRDNQLTSNDSSRVPINNEYGTVLPKSGVIKSEQTTRNDACYEPDIFKLLCNFDSYVKYENPNTNKEFEATDRNSNQNESPNYLNDKEIFRTEFITKSPSISEVGESKFNLSELLNDWDEDNQFMEKTKSSVDLDETLEFNVLENWNPNVRDVKTNASPEIIPLSSNRNIQSPALDCKDNSSLDYRETFGNKNVILQEHLEIKENNLTSPSSNDDIDKFKNCYDERYQSINIDESADKFNNHFDENVEKLNSSFVEEEVSAGKFNDLWNLDILNAGLLLRPKQKIKSELNESTDSGNKLFQNPKSPIQITGSLSVSTQNSTLDNVFSSSSSAIIPYTSVTDSVNRSKPAALRPSWSNMESDFQTSGTTIQPSVEFPSLTLKTMRQSCGSPSTTRKKIGSTFQNEPMRNEVGVQHSSVSIEQDKLVLNTKKSSSSKETENIESKETVPKWGVSSKDFRIPTIPNISESTPVILNRKPTCSIFVSSRLKSLSKNKSASVATGRPVAKRKDIPFLMKGKLKRIK